MGREEAGPRRKKQLDKANGTPELNLCQDFHAATKKVLQQNQTERILRLLLDARGAWVGLPEIMKCAAQYNARIYSLRRAGCNIENCTQEVNGVKHSWYRLIDPPAATTPSKTQTPNPEPSWKDGPRLTGLPLFDLEVRP